jgi:hypothetical protein
MRRRWILLVLLVGSAAVALTVVLVRSPRFQKWYRPPVLVLPEADEIAEMRARAFHVEAWPWTEATQEFVVPPAHVPHLLHWLRPSQYAGYEFSVNADNPIYPVSCEILIRTQSRLELRLVCREWGKNPVAFTPNGEDYFLGDAVDEDGRYIGGIGLHIAVRNAHDAARRQCCSRRCFVRAGSVSDGIPVAYAPGSDNEPLASALGARG